MLLNIVGNILTLYKCFYVILESVEFGAFLIECWSVCGWDGGGDDDDQCFFVFFFF